MLLPPSESLALAKSLGIPVPEEVDEPPACVKADVPLPHKTDVGAVVCAETEEELERAKKLLEERYGKVIVQKMVKGELELLVSSKLDPAFGRVAVLALGGVLANALKESVVTACPVCEPSLLELLKGTKLGSILFSKRLKIDIGCVIDVMKKLCNVDYKVFEINPLIVGKEGCWAVDVKVWA